MQNLKNRFDEKDQWQQKVLDLRGNFFWTIVHPNSQSPIKTPCKKMMPQIVSFIFILLMSFVCVTAQTVEVDQIQIASSWGGLGVPAKNELTIVHKKTGYFIGRRKIDYQLVERFLGAVEETKIDKPELENLGITQEWLNQNAEKSMEGYISSAVENQRNLYLSSFKDRALVEKLVPSLLRGGWTDDYPHVEVTISVKNGDGISVTSDKQPEWMLPWSITKNGQTFSTFNAHISTALAALLPNKFPNRERISGQGIERNLAQGVMRFIDDDWKMLEVENKAKAPLDLLKNEYTVISAEINSNNGWDFGIPWAKKGPTETNLHALLRKNSFPKRFAIKIIMPFHDKDVQNLDLFQRKIGEYQASINSVPWLKDAIESGDKEVWLRFVNNRSFSDRAMEIFSADMKKIGKGELIPEVERSKEKIALISVGGWLEYYQSYWLIMPNGQVILWSGGREDLLKWKSGDFAEQECSDPRSNTKPCIGAVISREGDIVSR